MKSVHWERSLPAVEQRRQSPKAFPALLLRPPAVVPECQDAGEWVNVVPALTTENDTMKKDYCSELLKFSFELKLEEEKKETHFVWLLCSTVCVQQNLGERLSS